MASTDENDDISDQARFIAMGVWQSTRLAQSLYLAGLHGGSDGSKPLCGQQSTTNSTSYPNAITKISHLHLPPDRFSELEARRHEVSSFNRMTDMPRLASFSSILATLTATLGLARNLLERSVQHASSRITASTTSRPSGITVYSVRDADLLWGFKTAATTCTAAIVNCSASSAATSRRNVNASESPSQNRMLNTTTMSRGRITSMIAGERESLNAVYHSL